MYQYSKVERPPQFGLLSRLSVSLLASDLTWLPAILENCPQLKSLFLVVNLMIFLTCICETDYLFIAFTSLYHLSFFSLQVWYGNSELVPDDEMSQISLPPMIECLLSSLEFVDIETRVSGDDIEMKLVWYFLLS